VTRLLGLLWLNIVRQFLTWSASWWFAVALAAGQVVPPLVGLAVWRTVFPASSQITRYYVVLLFVAATTGSYENHTFSRGIYRGTIAGELVKPQPVMLVPLGENLAIRAWLGLIASPVVVLAAVLTSVSLQPGALLTAVPLWLGGGLLRFLFTWCLAMVAFWTQRVDAITGFGTALLFMLGGNAVPINLLPPFWATVAHALPFYSMLGLPADVAAGEPASAALAGAAVQVAWLAIMALAATALWRRGLRRYTAVGS
jgi:ABC-2 type transport system permease protein